MKDVAQNLFAQHNQTPNAVLHLSVGYEMYVFWEEKIPNIGKVLKYYPTTVAQCRKDLSNLMRKAGNDVSEVYSMIGCVQVKDMV